MSRSTSMDSAPSPTWCGTTPGSRALGRGSMARRTAWSAASVLALLIGATASGVAQTNTPVTGIAEDQTEAIVPGALVILINRATGEVRQTFADKTGRFAFEVPPGDYSLLARAEDLESRETAVTIGTTPFAIRLRLKVGLQEQLTVTAGHQDALAPDDNATAVAFDENMFRQLPADSENILPLVTAFLAPAALGAEGVSMIIDGIETDQLDVPAWAIKDLLVNSNPFSAVYQRPGTARIEVTTKQTSRRLFRRNLAVSDRNSALDARGAFAIDKPHLDRRLIDAGLSGPLPFDHASFFVNGSPRAAQGTASV